MQGIQVKDKQKQYCLQSWSKQKYIDPIAVEKAQGIYFWDYDGNRYTDMSSQLVNMNLGFGNKEIGDAIKAQVDKYCYLAPSYASDVRGELAEKLISLMPEKMAKVFFTNAGAEANENAIKIARLFTGRNKVFSRYRSYHGSSFGAGNLTGEPRRYALEPGIPGFVKFFDPYLYREAIEFESEKKASEFYLKKLEEQIWYEGPDSVAAIVMETITGSNGVIIPPDGYMKGVRELCTKYGIMMICDEVMTGFCRTGKMFAFENFDVEPDLVTFAKGITCGYVPLGGVVVSREIAEYFDENLLSCGLTYSGHPLACAAGLACLSYYEDAKIAQHVTSAGEVLGRRLVEMKEKFDCIGDVRFIGLFSAVELVKDKTTKEPIVPYGKNPEGIMKKIIGLLKKQGFMTYSHENMVIIAPPLIITQEQLSEELDKFESVMRTINEGGWND